MNQLHQQHQTEDAPSNRQLFEFTIFVLRVWALSVEVFVRHSMGVRYPGFVAPFVFLLIPIYSLFWPQYDLLPMFVFLGAYLIALACHRVSAVRRALSGYQGHTYYSGTPRVMWLCRGREEVQVKAILEPMFIGFIAIFIAAFNEPLGMFLLLGALCIALLTILDVFSHHQRSLDVRDQMIEQQHVARGVRQRRG